MIFPVPTENVRFCNFPAAFSVFGRAVTGGGEGCDTISPAKHRSSKCGNHKLHTPRALSTCTYGEVSPIFLSVNTAKSDVFVAN